MTCSLNMVMREDEKFKLSQLHIWKNLMHITNASPNHEAPKAYKRSYKLIIVSY